MDDKLNNLKIGNPALRALNEAGKFTLKQVSEYSEKELLSLHGVGPKAVRLLKEAIEKEGLYFRNND